jgi:hypothetical protein
MIGKPGTRISPDTVHRKVGSNDSHCGRQSRHAHIRHVRGDRNAGHRRRTATKAVVSRRLAAGLVLGFATEAIGTAAGATATGSAGLASFVVPVSQKAGIGDPTTRTY